MIKILPYFFAFMIIFVGGYISLLGFKLINPKKDNKEHQEKMIKWHKKFGGFAKYGGIILVIWGSLNLIFPSLNAYSFDNSNDSSEWTTDQKEQLMDQIIGASDYLKSINPDTARLVTKCFVDKYSEKFTVEEFRKQDKLDQDKVSEITMPIMKECAAQYGL